MKERLIQLLDLEQLSPSKFADIIGVQRSSVSHVISERNKPSFDFIQKTLRAFPGLNAEWLILGEGTMYEQMGRGVSGNLFDTPSERDMAKFPEDIQGSAPLENIPAPSEQPASDHIPEALGDQSTVSTEDSGISDTSKKVVQVMVFYDDDTFRSYAPSQ